MAMLQQRRQDKALRLGGQYEKAASVGLVCGSSSRRSRLAERCELWLGYIVVRITWAVVGGCKGGWWLMRWRLGACVRSVRGW